MVSPFVRATITDQPIYAAPAPTTIPLVIMATRGSKSRPDGAGIAPGTLEANRLRIVTSQRELIQNYGNPVYVTSSGAPVPGDETNEYGLHALHTILGLTSRAYVLRADIDLAQLIPTAQEPTLPPPDATYWMDKDAVVGGVFRWTGGSWVRIQDYNSVDANDFHVFTAPPTNSDGVDGDWGWDYSTVAGRIVFKSGGAWLAASDANLANEYGAGTNMFLSPTPPTGAVTGDFWYKLTSNSGGVDAKISMYRSVDASWVTQTIIRQNTMPVPNQGTLWEDLSQTNTTGDRPIYVGTGTTFIPIIMFVQDSAPVSEPATGTLWYNDRFTDFALYVEGSSIGFGNQWVPIETTTVSNPTNRQKVISASAPYFPAQGAIWVDLSSNSNIDNFPVIKKYTGSQWIDITASVVMSDSDPIASAVLDGTYWLNLGESKTTNTIKKYNPSFTAKKVELQTGVYVVVDETDNHWEPAVGGVFGRKAQRTAVTRALQAAISANEDIRAEIYYYQLIASPGYPELYNEMLTLNSDNNETAFIVGDTPKFMVPSGIATGREVTITEWISNARNVASTGEEGFASAPSPFAGFWYPWGMGTDLSGNDVVVPPSYMALRTLAYNDSVAAPWYAPAGFRRGRVDNVSSVGYINDKGEFTPLVMNRGMRDVAYANRINPITMINDQGLVVFGQKTMSATATALDRINVARLLAKMKYDLQRLLEAFLFEHNDPITRRSAQNVTERYLSGLKALRALYDYAVRCDEANNTPDRIDANELWVDVAIKPAKVIEFIHIPINILATGDSLPF